MTKTSAIPPRREQTSLAPPPRLLDVLQQGAAERGHSGNQRELGAGIRDIHRTFGTSGFPRAFEKTSLVRWTEAGAAYQSGLM
jgi:hypothetical protein